jgi:hypothetical protein
VNNVLLPASRLINHKVRRDHKEIKSYLSFVFFAIFVVNPSSSKPAMPHRPREGDHIASLPQAHVFTYPLDHSTTKNTETTKKTIQPLSFVFFAIFAIFVVKTSSSKPAMPHRPRERNHIASVAQAHVFISSPNRLTTKNTETTKK